MPDVLNLAGADLTAGEFEPIPTAWYKAYVVKMEDKFTKGGEDAKLPQGTPMLNIHFKIADGEHEGRYQFRTLVIPPAKVNGKKYEHYQSMMGQVAKFFICLGEDEATVLGGEFDISDRERFIGREIGIKVKLYNNTFKGEMDNKVEGFKLASELDAVGAGVPGLV